MLGKAFSQCYVTHCFFLRSSSNSLTCSPSMFLAILIFPPSLPLWNEWRNYKYFSNLRFAIDDKRMLKYWLVFLYAKKNSNWNTSNGTTHLSFIGKIWWQNGYPYKSMCCWPSCVICKGSKRKSSKSMYNVIL